MVAAMERSPCWFELAQQQACQFAADRAICEGRDSQESRGRNGGERAASCVQAGLCVSVPVASDVAPDGRAEYFGLWSRLKPGRSKTRDKGARDAAPDREVGPSYR